MEVGDLVRVVSGNGPFRYKPDEGSIGIIIEVKEFTWIGTCYFVLIEDISWRFLESELELIDGSG